MSEEEVIYRKGYLRGLIEGIRLYAIWRDGKQFVGILQEPLEKVLEPYQKELKTLTGHE